MSYSWVDPHFASLFALREEERLTARLARSMRERAPDDESVAHVVWGRAAYSSAFEDEKLLHGLDPRRQL